MKTSSMMNSIHFALLLQFLIWTALTNADNKIRGDPSDEVKLQIIDKKQNEYEVKLRKAVSFLANENSPVWTVRRNAPGVLIPDFEVMNKVGRFSLYQNSDHSSAAVYFHKLHEFYGTIDVRFILKAIRLEHIKNRFEVKFSTNHGVQERNPFYSTHRRSRSTNNTNAAFYFDPSVTNGEILPNRNHSSIRSRRNIPDTVYVKTLIIVNYDLLISIIPEFLTNIEIVHYLLTLFNNVDMLYSKVENPKIKINIAGIIIGTDRTSFPTLSRCHSDKTDGYSIKHFLDANCVNSAIHSYLHKQSNVISPDSYNAAIFLTSYRLYEKAPTVENFLGGMTFVPPLGPYNMKKYGWTVAPIISVHHKKYFGNFHVIAHEIAHALRVQSHDKGPYVDEDENCLAYIMKPVSDFCENCLSWSPATLKSLEEYFSSRNRCFFINKPHSLETPGPHEISTANEQCQCYGYESAGTPKRSLMDKIRGVTDTCRMNLKCYDSEGKSHKALTPLDGTPCGEHMDSIKKVCWHKKCTPVLPLCVFIRNSVRDV